MADKPVIHIDKSSPIPLYIQLERELRNLIQKGRLDNLNFQLTEKFLEKNYRISISTVRRAVSKLVDEGLLIRKRAHGISIVNDASKMISETTNGLSFTEAAIKQGFIPSAKTIKSVVQKPPKDVREALSLAEDETVFFSRRIRYLNKKPVAIADYYIPLRYAPDISESDFSETGPNQSGHYILEKLYDIQILKRVESIEAIGISPEYAKILEIPSGSPVIRRNDIVYSTKGKNVCYNKVIMTTNYKITGLVYIKEHLN